MVLAGFDSRLFGLFVLSLDNTFPNNIVLHPVRFEFC